MPEELTENTPLISNEEGVNQVRVAEEQNQQLKAIYLVHFLSTISTSIFTFNTFHFIIQEKVGFRTDFRVYHSFIIAKILLGLEWGYYSDKVGRKRVLNICLLGSALMMFLFGFCNSVLPAIFASFLLGAFNCVYSVIKTIFGESTNRSNRPLSFIVLIIITAIAFCIRKIISLALNSHVLIPPANPGLPSDQLKFPFLISCIIACGINIITFILSHLYLSETLGNSVNLEGNDSAVLLTNHSDSLSESELYTILGLNISKDSILILIGFPLITVISVGFCNISIHWFSNEVGKGGLNLKENQITICLVVSSITSLVTLILYSSIHKRLGSLKLYRNFFLPTAVVFIISSMITLVARTGNVPAVITLAIFAISALEIFSYLQNISLNLLLIESSELTGHLGSLFGVSCALENTFRLVAFLSP
ncbi:MFS general substrate transporter [Conidiobolus coronatus NRRL 28638]|uniref:MFS general substrate transporter n=1 Tax=Conidiobolus coronatus (strain ATCC 28846 / CBS 209.66 / NRRL 28638) TaxID=796925 RepID=A0A137NQQ5_CONC2|nr:MFS general substrate transporter [Conidiobolus coronatus NRRL 28638]|eukprot:KXN65096.1 MFS general substrate transporter [Conidiobolus coronatus NRRL 28638]